MSPARAKLRASALACLAALSAFASGPGERGEICVFDLRPTLSFDAASAESANRAWDETHAAATLQGLANRDAPRLYLRLVECGGRDIDMHWLQKYSEPGEWLHGRKTVEINSLEELFERFGKFARGAVVYDGNVPATSAVASAVAGAEGLVAVRFDPSPGSVYSRIVLAGPKLEERVRLVNRDGSPMFTGRGTIPGTRRKSTGSAKNDAHIWMLENCVKSGKCKTEFGAYYIDQFWRRMPDAAPRNHHTLANHDFFVSKRAFFFDLSPWGDEPATDEPEAPPGADLDTLKEILAEVWKRNGGKKMCHIGGFPPWAFKYTRRAGGGHGDVETEWEFSRVISAYNAFKDADAIGYGAMANASFWTHFPLEKSYPQKWVSHAELKRRGLLDERGRVDFKGRQFYIFYVGDYDSSSWISQRAPDIWDSPARGTLPLMWCVSPVLAARAPHVMHHFRKTASPNDYFAAADNGAGYLMPGMLQEPRPISGLPSGLDAWAGHCRAHYQKWGLRITGFVIDGHAPALNEKGLDCYASFSPGGIVPQKSPPASLHAGMPVLRSDWDLVSDNPAEAAAVLCDRIRDRAPLRFHWFRSILKSPQWHAQVREEVSKRNPDAVLLDAPAFFELLKIWLESGGGAEGKEG